MTFKYSTGPMRPRFIKDIKGDHFNVEMLIYLTVTERERAGEFLVRAYFQNDHDGYLFKSKTEEEARDWMDSLVKSLNSVAE